jgi:hypothetical protein
MMHGVVGGRRSRVQHRRLCSGQARTGSGSSFPALDIAARGSRRKHFASCNCQK